MIIVLPFLSGRALDAPHLSPLGKDSIAKQSIMRRFHVVVWPSFAEAQRRTLLKAQLLAVTGTLQQESGVLHLITGRLENLTAWLGNLDARSRDFH
jgi:hypothetical protein